MKKWKKWLSIMMTAAMVLGGQSLGAVGIWAAEETTINVYTVDDLKAVATKVNGGTDNYSGKTVILRNNIDLNGTEWTPIGIASFITPSTGYAAPYYAFKGTFNGNGFTISNFKVSHQNTETVSDDNGNKSAGNEYDHNKNLALISKGLFGFVDGGTIENLHISGATINGWNAEAAAIGTIYGASTVSNVDISNSTVSGTYENAGAVIGRQYGSAITIKNCDVDKCNITLPANNSYENGAGGLIGRLQNPTSTITDNSVSNSSVTAYRKAAGLIGYILQPTQTVITSNAISNTNITINASAVNAKNKPYCGIITAEIQGATNTNRAYDDLDNLNQTVASYPLIYSTENTADFGTLNFECLSNSTYDAYQNGELHIAACSQKNAVKMNGVPYPSVSAAVASSADNPSESAVITLGEDVIEPIGIFTGKNVTLDLNSHKISSNAYAVMVNGGTLTLTDTSVSKTGEITASGGAAVKVYGDVSPDHSHSIKSSLTLNNGTIRTTGGSFGIGVFGKGADVVVNDGSVIAVDNSAIGGNGTKNGVNDFGGYSITINGGTLTAGTTSKGWANCGLYHPNAGDVTINGGTISGTAGAGIVVRGGNLTVTGGTISGNGTGGAAVKMGDATATYCGGIEVGYMTSIGTDYPGGIGAISISGGYISSTNSGAINVISSPSNSTHSKSSCIEVKGGYFTSNPSEVIDPSNKATTSRNFVSTGYKAIAGNWTINSKNYAYIVSNAPANKIESVSTKAYNGSAEDTSTEVVASLRDNVITITGKLPTADTKVILTYTTTDRTLKTIEITEDSIGYQQPNPFTVGNITYTINISSLLDMPEDVTTVAPAADKVTLPDSTKFKDPVTATAAVTAINTAIESSPSSLSADGLSAAAADTVKTTGIGGEEQITVPVGDSNGTKQTTITDVLTTAKANTSAPSEIQSPTNENPLVVIVQPIIKIEVTDAVKNDGKTTIKLDVSALTQAIVTTKSIADTKTSLVTDGQGINAVKVGEPAPMVVNNDVALTIPVPSGFVSDANKDKIFIQHEMHNGITETVKAVPGSDKYSNTEFYKTESFTVHGLSPITMVTDDRNGTVVYQNADGTLLKVVEYTPADINATALPTVAASSGSHQTGWQIDSITYPLGTLSDKMLTAVNEKNPTATPVFAADSTPSTPATYKVSFDANGGTGTMDAVSVTSGSDASLPEMGFTYTGHNFLTWNTAKDGSGASYRNGGKVAAVKADVTLYAQWVKAPTSDGKLLSFPGDTRYETMEMLVDLNDYDAGGSVVIANGEGYADALAAAGFAGLKKAPIILTAKGSLSAEAMALIQALIPTSVYIAGGEKAVTPEVVDAVRAIVPDASFKRFDGVDRFDTAMKIYAEGGTAWSKQAIIVDGENYADALSIAPYAYASGSPIFLSSEKDALNEAALKAINGGSFTNAIIAGGEKAVPESVDGSQLKIPSNRFSGKDRYDTCSEFDAWAVGASNDAIQPLLKMTYTRPAVSTGKGFADALAGSAYCGSNNSVLLLADDGNLECIEKNLKDNASSVVKVSIFGGVNAVPDTVRAAVKSAVG